MLTKEQIEEGWKDMSTAPRDGTIFSVLCQKGAIAHEIFYGQPPLALNRGLPPVLRGTQNILSPYLIPIGWRERGWKFVQD